MGSPGIITEQRSNICGTCTNSQFTLAFQRSIFCKINNYVHLAEVTYTDIIRGLLLLYGEDCINLVYLEY